MPQQWIVILKTVLTSEFFPVIFISHFRLYQLLEGENKKKELFITHGNLEDVAEKLKQDVSLVQSQLVVSAQEHSSFLSKLNSDVDMLCEALYQGGNRLLLSDQVGTCCSNKKCFKKRCSLLKILKKNVNMRKILPPNPIALI